MQIYVEVTMIFDDVKFGIDVRVCRILMGLTQNELAQKIGYKDGSAISDVEVARRTDSMTVRRYMALCNATGLNPMHYWACDENSDPVRLDWRDTDGA